MSKSFEISLGALQDTVLKSLIDINYFLFCTTSLSLILFILNTFATLSIISPDKAFDKIETTI